MSVSSSHLLEHEHTRIAKRSIESYELLNSALEATPKPDGFPDKNRLAGQLSLVARTIAARQDLGAKRQDLGAKRQVFFCVDRRL